MFDTYEIGRFTPTAFPRFFRVASWIASAVIVGVLLFQTAFVGAQIVA